MLPFDPVLMSPFQQLQKQTTLDRFYCFYSLIELELLVQVELQGNLVEGCECIFLVSTMSLVRSIHRCK